MPPKRKPESSQSALPKVQRCGPARSSKAAASEAIRSQIVTVVQQDDAESPRMAETLEEVVEVAPGAGLKNPKRGKKSWAKDKAGTLPYISNDASSSKNGSQSDRKPSPMHFEKEKIRNLPEPPEFDFLKHPISAHVAQPQNIPLDIAEDPSPSPLKIFELFYTDETLNELATNTNLYAEMKRAEQANLNSNNQFLRAWKPTCAAELKVLLGLQIYMGVFKFPSIEDYWTEGVRPLITNKMSLVRFQQLKRFLHVSRPDQIIDSDQWWTKLEPLASQLRDRYKEYYMPASDMAYYVFKGKACILSRCQGNQSVKGIKYMHYVNMVTPIHSFFIMDVKGTKLVQ